MKLYKEVPYMSSQVLLPEEIHLEGKAKFKYKHIHAYICVRVCMCVRAPKRNIELYT